MDLEVIQEVLVMVALKMKILLECLATMTILE